MKNVYKQKREQGFTIIEVLIVLAIAALIFLIVFLAVPALNRNSRNNAIKHDAANVLSGVQTFESNNNGVLPTGIACTGGTATITGGGGTQQNQISVQGGTTCNAISNTFVTAGTGNLSKLFPASGQECNGNIGYSANARSFAISFLVETGSASQATQCVDS
jgi:prepilin-type N-terminal cleavage/methylation domain-containing protein